MADSMKLKIVAPERIFYEGESSFLEFTTTEGDMGVYPNHIPLTAIIAPGVLRSRYWQRVWNGRRKLMQIVRRKQKSGQNAGLKRVPELI